MPKYKITGGNKLKGSIEIGGAKNAALPILVGSILTNEKVVLNNVPTKLNDIQWMIEIIKKIGCNVEIDSKKVIIQGKPTSYTVPIEEGNKIRSSLILLGALLNTNGKAVIPNPGGCNIGDRRFDIHIDSLKLMGAEIKMDQQIIAEAPKLFGKELTFYLPTTTGTQNVILAALAAKSTTKIKNANTRPENLDFANFLKTMGANILMKNRVVIIDPSTDLYSTEYTIMSGRDEMITYIIAAAITGGEIQIKNASLEYIPTSLNVFRNSGLEIFEWGNSVYVSAKNPLKKIDIATAPYPGINSDMQPLFTVYAAAASGESTITDMRFTDRFQYVEEIKKIGMDIEAFGNSAVVNGNKKLHGCEITATDLRGGAAMVLAGLIAEGETIVDNIYQIERGYENIVEKLTQLGAQIERIE